MLGWLPLGRGQALVNRATGSSAFSARLFFQAMPRVRPCGGEVYTFHGPTFVLSPMPSVVVVRLSALLSFPLALRFIHFLWGAGRKFCLDPTLRLRRT